MIGHSPKVYHTSDIDILNVVVSIKWDLPVKIRKNGQKKRWKCTFKSKYSSIMYQYTRSVNKVIHQDLFHIDHVSR